MKRLLNLGWSVLLMAFIFASCNSDDDLNLPKAMKGNFVLNESSSITLIQHDGTVTQNYFESVNKVALGKYPQSMLLTNEYGFIVVTESGKPGYVEVVTAADFKHYETIKDLKYPREVAANGNKLYISTGNGADKAKGHIVVVDLKTMKKTNSTEVGAGPEKLIINGNYLYVANSGGWSNDDNTISVIDLATEKVVKTYTVKMCPKDMVLDADNNLWVFCGGKPDYSNYPNVTYADPGISKVNTNTGNVVSWDIVNKTAGLKNIAITKDRKTIYFMTDGVYSVNYKANKLPTEKILPDTYYGININPKTGNIWVCKSNGTDPGMVIVYTKSGDKVTEYTTGAFPNETIFSY